MAERWPPKPVPLIPPPILQAAEEASLVIFVGAGVSRLMGCPSWDELANSCLRRLAETGLITFGEVDQLSQLDVRKRLTIASRVAAARNQSLDLPSLVRPKHLHDSRIYEYLGAIDCPYVTTNYDRLLLDHLVVPTEVGAASSSSDSHRRTDVISRPEHFSIANLLQPRVVTHLHGCIDDPDNMIVTTPDYLTHYENSHVREFLDDLFSRYTVLFIGYGLEEWEILEHILRKGAPSAASHASRFLLDGYFSHQEMTFHHLQNYYRDAFGVELVPYARDQNDYQQLEYVLRDWSGRLASGPRSLASDLAFVLDVADD